MFQQKGFYRKVVNTGIGPGGWHCPCCGPAPGKDRYRWKRLSRKKYERLVKLLINDGE